jgi:hypothetical protein
MGKNFVSHQKRKPILTLEEKIKEQISRIFRIHIEFYTYDMVRCIKAKNVEFSYLYKRDKKEAWRQVLKVLRSMEAEGFLELLPSGKAVIDPRFPNYKWGRADKGLCRYCGWPLKDHYSGAWM